MAWRQRQTGPSSRPIPDWITREFARRGLVPPHCTPEALARALERERGITIAFVPLASDDPGVYGMLYRHAGREDTYSIVFRPTHSIVLRRLILFHELAHLLFRHALTDIPGVGGLRRCLITSADDAVAEAFATGAMPYSFLDADTPPPRAAEDDGAPSFGRFLRRMGG